jgi:hypothetical protein
MNCAQQMLLPIGIMARQVSSQIELYRSFIKVTIGECLHVDRAFEGNRLPESLPRRGKDAT